MCDNLMCISVKGNKVFPKSKCYEEHLFGYPRLEHTDICTFIFVFNRGKNLVRDKGSRD